MRIAVIGAGTVGSGVAAAAVKAGHEVALASRHAERAAAVACEVGARAVETAEAAVDDADMVALAVPSLAVANVRDQIRPQVARRIRRRPDQPAGARSVGCPRGHPVGGRGDRDPAAGGPPW